MYFYAHPDTALLQYFWEAGLLYRGTFAGRVQDTVGLAVNQSRISSQLISAEKAAGGVAVQSAETDIELKLGLQAGLTF